MQILHFIYDDVQNPWCGGGGARRAFEMYQRLPETHEATIVTGNFPGASLRQTGRVTYLRCGSAASYLLSRLTYTVMAPAFIRRIPHDIVISDFSAFSPVFPKYFTQRTTVSIIHHYLGRHTLKKFPVIGIAPYWFERIHFQQSRHVIVVSEEMVSLLRTMDDSKEYRCIHNGIDSSLLEIAPASGEHILFLGRLDVYMKGLDILIRAYANLPENQFPLILAGNGKPGDVQKIQHLITELGLESRVQLPGRVSAEKKKDLLARSVCVCMPSRFEGWGIVAIEAAAAGKPVVGSRIPGLQEAILEDKTGLLVDVDDVEGLTQALSRVVHSTDLQLKLGTAGKDWASGFDWDILSKLQFEYYQEVIDSVRP